MIFFSDDNLKIFSILALIYSAIEIANIIVHIFFSSLVNAYFDLGSIIALPFVVVIELLFVLWERNKITIHYYPYSVDLQDKGTYYALMTREKSETLPLKEDTLKILFGKKGFMGKRYLKQIVFRTRKSYSIEFASEGEISFGDISVEQQPDETLHKFPFIRTEFKEPELEYHFYVRRNKKEGMTNVGTRFYFKMELEYDFKLLRTSFPVKEVVEFGTRLL